MMFRHIKFFLFISVLLFLVLTHAMAGDFPPDIQRIINRGKIIVAMHQEDAPPSSCMQKMGVFMVLM